MKSNNKRIPRVCSGEQETLTQSRRRVENEHPRLFQPGHKYLDTHIHAHTQAGLKYKTENTGEPHVMVHIFDPSTQQAEKGTAL